ncbi:hypothetical protein FHV99_004626 [Ochrobactrum sp. P20RRXII]|nr:hypothetical protein [Ochrobactrum sp. P20RRXII]
MLRKLLCKIGFHSWSVIEFETSRVGGPYVWMCTYEPERVCRHCNRLKYQANSDPMNFQRK